MANKFYTVMIVPERSAKVRRLQIPHRTLLHVVLVFLGLVGLAGFLGVHYVYMVDQARQNTTLKDENIALKTRLRVVQDEIARISTTLGRIEQFSTKIRAITQLNDPDRNLAIGPVADASHGPTQEVLYAQGERIEYEDELIDSNLAMRLIDSSLDSLDNAALKQEQSVRELNEFFADQRFLLTNTPSIRPARSKLLTSSFGVRKDPYTDQRVMHKGIDLAADHGADVLAPADGVVVYAGNRGHGYGKTVVIDHGFGIQTHYAHLSAFKIEIGDQVRRGQLIAWVGNTGRTTGAHLHYEVRFLGIPQDPEKFIFD